MTNYKNFLVVLGTRPEAIKLCPLILFLKKTSNITVCVTGQHKALLNPFLKLFNVTPDYDLALLQQNQSLADLSARCLQGISKVIQAVTPDCVIVQGDTTSSMCAALAAFYEKIPVAHIEAGLRTYDIYSPFPEEINRQITSRIARYHFVPTEKNKQNLLQEGCHSEKIFMTGNTGIDALLWVLRNHPIPTNKIINADLHNKKIILVTGHRRENFGKPFENICYVIKKIAGSFQNVLIIYPVHLNPNVQKPVYNLLSGYDNIKLIPPLNYPEFISVMASASIILTDSGGVQEEAPSLRIPILVMRNTTERPEAVENGFSFLVGTDPENILHHVTQVLTNKDFYHPQGGNPYGDGSAVEKISEILINSL